MPQFDSEALSRQQVLRYNKLKERVSEWLLSGKISHVTYLKFIKQCNYKIAEHLPNLLH
jgi:hypothetical protein